MSENKGLENRTPEDKPAILITGGAARIGAALARGLASDGWAVCIHYFRSQSRAQALVDEIKASGGQAACVKGNLAVPQDVDNLIDRAASVIGQPLTALINNASTFSDDRIDSFTRGSMDHHMDVNLHAPLHLSQSFAKQLPKGESGCIVNIIDQRVLKPNPLFFTYSLSKSSLYWATKTLAQSLAPSIRVNAIGPGPTLQNTGQNEDDFSREAEATLLGEGSPPDTILDAMRYLLSAKAVTGQMIAVDGGQHLTWQTPDLLHGGGNGT